jgi:hypothetical protein
VRTAAAATQCVRAMRRGEFWQTAQKAFLSTSKSNGLRLQIIVITPRGHHYNTPAISAPPAVPLRRDKIDAFCSKKNTRISVRCAPGPRPIKIKNLTCANGFQHKHEDKWQRCGEQQPRRAAGRSADGHGAGRDPLQDSDPVIIKEEAHFILCYDHKQS